MSQAPRYANGACDCGLAHTQTARLRRLRRMLPASTAEIIAAYPCSYVVTHRAGGKSEARTLMRDLALLGARRTTGRFPMWTLEGSHDREDEVRSADSSNRAGGTHRRARAS